MSNPEHIFELQHLRSRSASAENPSAAPGQGGMAAHGFKGSPAIKNFTAGSTETLLDISGPGKIRHIWCTSSSADPDTMRNIIVRMYWDHHDIPSVEAPLGDFFGVAHGTIVSMQSCWITRQNGSGFNCYFPMPFATHARIEISNNTQNDIDWFFYQIDFTLGDTVTDDHGRFHCTFNRYNPAPYGEDVVLLNTNGGKGVYIGCVIGIRPLAPGWWGEGEVKMYIDNDTDYPTICGTGTEDYIGAAWGLHEQCTLYQGAPLVGTHTSLYRFHCLDPIYFEDAIRVTIQQMGNAPLDTARKLYGDQLIYSRKNHPCRDPDDVFYLRSDDYSCVAFWYQYPLLHKRDALPDTSVRSRHLFNREAEQKKEAAL